MRREVVLVSPGPVDGYPPVQYQARILADAGHPVTLVTTPLNPGKNTTAFAHPGVDVHCVSAEGRRAHRVLRFARALLGARRALPRESVEIAYDPLGLLFSDLVPLRPRRRVAHLHEMLQTMDKLRESRLRTAIHRYDVVVVPDHSRAELTQRQLALAQAPLVVENYPLRADTPMTWSRTAGQRFEVVYCGSLGLNQKLDQVIRSIPLWPSHADFVMVGNDETPTSEELRTLAREQGVADRVHFLGWVNTPDAERRLAVAHLGIALLDPGFEQWRTALGASNKRYQYMKAGIPQIGDFNPGVPELLNGIGACARTHEPAEIGRLVAAYVEDAERCAEEGARAFARHRATYNYERVFRRLQNLIEQW